MQQSLPSPAPPDSLARAWFDARKYSSLRMTAGLAPGLSVSGANGALTP